MSKKAKGGNKRGQINPHKQPKGAQAESIAERLAEVRETTCIDEIIELTRHENNLVRLKATQ